MCADLSINNIDINVFNQNKIWYYENSSLQLKGDKQMNRGTDLHERLKKVLTKLYTLRDSCRGIIITERYPPDFSWFEGAAGICEEANGRIREAGSFLAKSKEEPLTDSPDD
jgi:hypothetical protein